MKLFRQVEGIISAILFLLLDMVAHLLIVLQLRNVLV
ncbi:hypothetical protein BLGT_02210 [Bifidobacterium longum subsp. longum GT15]|nr:hypothetical protein BLGT_02210 [Bifidobacterium longum subsp. longum GT15]